MKRKISTGLVLAMVMMMLAAGAVAEEQWGILTFMKEQGKAPAEEKLVKQPNQTVTGVTLVDIAVAEALRDGETLYLALVVKPMQESTLVIPNYGAETGMQLQDISELGRMQIMDNADCDPNLSVKEYAEATGFERVVSISIPRCTADDGRNDPESLMYAAFDHLKDGTLRMILQYDCLPDAGEAWQISAAVEAFNADGLLDRTNGETIEMMVDIPVNRD